MSVYTKVSAPQLRSFLRHYPVGELLEHRGISAGIENTNYFVDTRDGHWVLTLFERAEEADLPYFLALMDHLALRGIPAPRPMADNQGNFLTHLCGKPAALVQKLPGNTISQPNKRQCAALGLAMAELHLAGQSFAQQRENCRGIAWREATAEAVLPHLSSKDAQLLSDETRLQRQHHAEHAQLPSGVIHADLFRDNALFEGDHLSGIIDFYFGCSDVLLYDLAVTVNDWCSHADGRIHREHYNAMTQAYVSIRPASAAERQAWPLLLRAAALRFWLSRLFDLHFPRDGELTHTKNPQEFANILRMRCSHPPQLP